MKENNLPSPKKYAKELCNRFNDKIVVDVLPETMGLHAILRKECAKIVCDEVMSNYVHDCETKNYYRLVKLEIQKLNI